MASFGCLRAESILACALLAVSAHAAEGRQGATTTDELRTEIGRVLAEGHTPGAAIAVVRRDAEPWVAGLGIANIESRRAATSETLFRIGSVSKQFVSLATLQLAARGRLSLDDPVTALVPEISFENRWERTDPVRVVHLLEHTTGWDDIHLREYAWDGSRVSLRDALAYGSSSRVSRWRPGTRMAYCNSGPAVAAYIVEKLSGQRFEDFVTQNLFRPIGLTSATYFEPPAHAAAALYRDGAEAASPYWHIIYRPSGAINASARDMAAYVQFLLNRGMSAGMNVVPATGIDRMEVPRSTWAARAGITTGYGLASGSLIRDGFVWRGHSGDIQGGLSELWYVPEHGIGYFTSINSGNGFDSFRIGQAIRRYLTRGLPSPPVPPPAQLPANAGDFAGWYEPASPRMQLLFFVERLRGLARIRFEDGRLTYRAGSDSRTYVPVDAAQFRRVYPSGPQDPVPTFTLLQTDEGRFIQMGTDPETLRRVSIGYVGLALGLVTYVLLSFAAIVIYAPVWIIAAVRHRAPTAYVSLKIWPLVSVLSLLAAGFSIALSADPIAGLGNFTTLSAGLWLATLVFALGAIAHVIVLWRTPPRARAGRAFSIAVAPALLIACGYFGYWGILGLRTWAD